MSEIAQRGETDAGSVQSFLERRFELKRHGTDIRTELVAGLTTFLTMVYIVFVNPDILGKWTKAPYSWRRASRRRPRPW